MVVFFMPKLLTIISIIFLLIISPTVFANNTTIEEFKFKSYNNIEYSINVLFPSTWKAQKNNQTLTIYNSQLESRVRITSTPFINSITCLINPIVSKIDSKFYLFNYEKKGFIVHQENILKAFKPELNDMVTVLDYDNGELNSKFPDTDKTYDNCFKQIQTKKIQYSITIEYSNNNEFQNVKDIVKSLNISDYASPDLANQRSPFKAIDDTIKDTPRTNIYIIIGLILLLLLFLIFLIYATRLKKDTNKD